VRLLNFDGKIRNKTFSRDIHPNYVELMFLANPTTCCLERYCYNTIAQPAKTEILRLMICKNFSLPKKLSTSLTQYIYFPSQIIIQQTIDSNDIKICIIKVQLQIFYKPDVNSNQLNMKRTLKIDQ
jgi:hypothetical protein